MTHDICSHTSSALNSGAKRSGVTCHMAMPQCCYLAKGANDRAIQQLNSSKKPSSIHIGPFVCFLALLSAFWPFCLLFGLFVWKPFCLCFFLPVYNSSIRVIARPILNYGERFTILRSISVSSNREDETWQLCHWAECAITRSYCIAMGHSRKTINGRTNSSRTAETFYMLPTFLHAAWRFFFNKT